MTLSHKAPAMPLPERIFVISDLHLGVPGPMRIFHAGDALSRFIRSCAAEPGCVELVILGDALDYLQLEPWLAFDTMTAGRKTQDIINANHEVFAALAHFMDHRPAKSLVWFIGNHDIELAFPSVRARIEAQIGGAPEWHLDNKARVYELPGGAKIRLVHGNDADVYNRVDYANLTEVVAGRGDPASVYPLGSHMVAEVLNPLKADGYRYIDLLKPEEQIALPLTLALWPNDLKQRLANAGPILFKGWQKSTMDRLSALLRGPRDSFRGPRHAPVPSDSEDLLLESILLALYAGDQTIQTDAFLDWLDKPAQPQAPAPGPAGTFRGARGSRGADIAKALLRGVTQRNTALDAFDVYGPDEYSDKSESVAADRGILVVVGHTHLARLRERAGSYYLNTGTWADLMRLPPNIERADFDLMAQTMLEHLKTPETGPAWLRPFRQLTFADIALPGGPQWHARLRRWPEDDAITLAACP